jgi:hypothetical protein
VLKGIGVRVIETDSRLQQTGREISAAVMSRSRNASVRS